VDRLEFIALISNALGYPGLETLSALNLGFGLEVVGAAVSAESRTPLEETSSGELVTGRNHVFVIIVCGILLTPPSVFGSHFCRRGRL